MSETENAAVCLNCNNKTLEMYNTEEKLIQMINDMVAKHEICFYITAGGLKNDWQSLINFASTHATENVATLKTIALGTQHVDILFDFAVSSGFFITLSSLLPLSDPPSTDVSKKCFSILAVYNQANSVGYLTRSSQSNQQYRWPLQQVSHNIESRTITRKFRSVETCLRLLGSHPPDQSWQTDPVDLNDFYKALL